LPAVTSSKATLSTFGKATAMMLLMAAIVGLQIAREHAPPLLSGDEELLYLRSPEAMKRIALSYDSLVADAYWIRAIQHYGSTKRSDEPGKTYELLYPLLDLTTSLDPLFNAAYQFGAIFLSEPFPGGPGRPDQAIELLQKGIKAQPDNWWLEQSLGFVYYWWYQDFKTAAYWFDTASKRPGAPNWMAPLAAVTLTHGGNRQASRQLWRHIAQTEADEWFRNEALRRLQQLDAMDALDGLRTALETFAARTGHPARSWSELVAARILRGIPRDPTGLTYRLDNGQVSLDPSSPLLPLPKAESLQ
jgi:hypothetical protein